METGYSDTHVTNLQECLAWLKGYAAQQNEADRALLQQALALAEAHYPADAQTHAAVDYVKVPATGNNTSAYTSPSKTFQSAESSNSADRRRTPYAARKHTRCRSKKTRTF